MQRNHPIWGSEASKGSKPPDLESSPFLLIAGSLKRGQNLKKIGNFITFSFELEKWVTHVNNSYGFQPHLLDESLIFKIKGSSFHLKGVLLHKLELLSRHPSYYVLNQRFQEPYVMSKQISLGPACKLRSLFCTQKRHECWTDNRVCFLKAEVCLWYVCHSSGW